MKTIILSAAALFAVSTFATAATIPPGCVPAIQNWVNASGYTCPVSDAGGDKFKRKVKEATEEPGDDESETAAK